MKIFSATVMVMLFSMTLVQCQEHITLEKKLPKELKEISGLAKDVNGLWEVGDNSKGEFCKLDLSGNIIQRVQITNYTCTDAEAITVDQKYVYIGDVGDNNGTRDERSIVRVPKSALGKKTPVSVQGEIIQFSFPDEGVVEKKKTNNYDCEAIMYYRDSIYLFTKRRDDDRTELYVIPAAPGTYSARSIGTFKAKGLVTDATINTNGTEMALVGYDPGHTQPFIWIFSGFSGNDFFSGTHKRYELTNEKKLDWQVESITYADSNSFFIACEKTKDVDNTLYKIKRSELRPAKKD